MEGLIIGILIGLVMIGAAVRRTFIDIFGPYLQGKLENQGKES